MPERYVKSCDGCKIGRKIGDSFSVDIKNVTDNWGHDAPCDICGKFAYNWVFKVALTEKIGDVLTVSIIGMMKRD